MTSLFCFGMGYSAKALAKRLKGKGWKIGGTSTSAEGAAKLRAEDYEAFVFDGAAAGAGIDQVLRQATHVLLSIPPSAEGDPALIHHGVAIAASPSVAWIGYLSTVGVYGDCSGAWVDEASPARPGSERSLRRLKAEQQTLELGAKSGKAASVFRLPGIYGPGRSAIETVLSGTARRIIKPGQVFNRIHVDDIAGTLEAAIAKPRQGAIYNVTDDEPAPPEDVISFAAQLLGRPEPPAIPFAEAHLSEMAKSFYAENKRVSNRLIKQELGVSLSHPTYREGLRAIAASYR
jgi:nucleoside-diphosphate-sugar epimerase